MSEFVQGGALANSSGKELELNVAEMLIRFGFEEITSKDGKKMVRNGGGLFKSKTSPWFVRQLPLHRNAYGSVHKADFVCWHPNFDAGFIIEAKYQKSSGSVDEKYLFTAVSLESMPQFAILLLEGAGTRPGVFKWLRKYSDKNQKRFKFMSMLDLLRFLENLTTTKEN